MTKNRIQSFYRLVKAEQGHRFAGLYAVEKVFFKDGNFVKKEIKHEWDLRIISEAILARLGGQDAYESYKLDNHVDEAHIDAETAETEPRTPEDIALNKRKLNKELRLDPKKD